MDKNILLSKIVATPTETSWTQAYSTLNLYVVLSIKALEAKDSIVTEGKELLERIQREYFSLDQKDLSNIKKSVENALAPVENKDGVSIVLATISESSLYIIIAGEGAVVLKRGEKIGPVAQGSTAEVAAFSGEIRPEDIVILETGDFSSKFPVSELSGALTSEEVNEISENLAPQVHENSLGTESAIILQVKNLVSTKPVAEEAVEEEEELQESEQTKETEEEESTEEEEEKREDTEEFTIEKPRKSFKIPGLNFFKGIMGNFGTKKIIILVIILLAVILAGSIYFEQQRAESAKRQAILQQIIDPAQKKFDEATALANLNKGLALDEFTSIKTYLDGKQSELKAGTEERKKLEEFIGKVEGKIGELGSGSTLANQKMIYDKGVDLVEFRGGTLAVVKADTGEVNILDTDGTSKKQVSTKNKNVTSVAGDDTSIFIMGDSGVSKLDNKTGKSSDIIKDISDTSSIDVFGSNLYGLNTNTKTVDKYVGQESPKSDYFKGDIKLTKPTSMTIDGSIYVLDDGKIRKFTKGAEDTFSVTGLTKDLSSDSIIFTSTDYSDIYVLDKTTTRIVAIGKSDGSVKNQYVSKDLSNATSFAIDEEGKKMFVVISGKLYSFDL